MRSFTVNSAGNIYLAGDNGNSTSSVLLLNSFGIKIRTFNLINTFLPISIESDSLSNVYLFGDNHSDLFLAKYNVNGIQQWTNKYNGIGNLQEFSSSMILDKSGNIYVTGQSNYPSTGNNYVTLKYNSSGMKQWMSRYWTPTSIGDIPAALALDNSGNVFVTGSSIGVGTENDYLTLKYPSSLQLNATISFEGLYNENANLINRKDTILAYIRNVSYPFAIVDSSKAIIDTNTFRCGFVFNNAFAGTYYISIKHKNSIETWSKSGGEVFTKKEPNYYNFTSSINQAYGNNQTQITSKYCFYSGDVNQDGFITLTDVISIYNNSQNFVMGSYLPTDLNGDSLVDLSDLTICYNNFINFIRVRNP